MTKKEYLSKLRESKCPSCGKEQKIGEASWDLMINEHNYGTEEATDDIYYSCVCGTHWVEHWEMTNFIIINPETMKFWTMDYNNAETNE